MFKFLRERKKDNKGFTLVELVIVVAILAILVGILAPQYTKYVEKSRKSADVDNVDELVKAVQVYAVDHAINTTKASTDQTVKFTLKDSGAVIDKDTSDKDVKAAFEEYVPNYTKISKKSKQWSVDPTVTLKIDKEGGVSVTECKPDEFASYSDGKNTASGSNAGNSDNTGK